MVCSNCKCPLRNSQQHLSTCFSYLFKVLDSFEIQPLLVKELQVLIIQLISPHLVLLLLFLHLKKQRNTCRTSTAGVCLELGQTLHH